MDIQDHVDALDHLNAALCPVIMSRVAVGVSARFNLTLFQLRSPNCEDDSIPSM